MTRRIAGVRVSMIENGARRADIQGLRAVAVGSVVLYHAGLPGFGGGFVGVDVFFVISGFLIVGLLMREMEASGSIDLLRFWSRRARRLLPNSALTLGAVLIAAATLMPVYRLADISGDVLAAALFVANFRFAERAVDYFRLDDPPSPILHFWSLGVEEQFYVVLPLLLVAIALFLRKGHGSAVRVLLAALFAASFALSVFISRENAPMAFFHTETRIWQLALGGLLAAYAVAIEGRVGPALRTCLGWAGAAAILGAVLLFRDDLAYPGYYALMPAAGTAALLVGTSAGGSSLLSRVLSNRLLCWIGDRSYSLYLWHWPILIFAQALFPAASVQIFAVALSVIVAHLAFVWVERPFHKGRWSSFSPPRTLLAGATGIVFLVAIAGALNLYPIGAFPERERAVAAAIEDFGRNYADGCHRRFDEVDQPPCRYGPAGAKRTVALVGDSHAAQWFEPVLSAAEATGWNAVSWTKSGCPLAEVTIWFAPRKAVYTGCEAWRRSIVERLKGPDRPDLVIVANANNYSGWIVGADRRVLAGRAAEDEWRRGIATIIDELRAAGLHLAVLRDTPKAYRNYRNCLASGADGDCVRPRAEALAGFKVDELFKRARPDVRFIDLTDLICQGDLCPAERDGLIVYRDSEHLTATFARTLAPSFEKLLESEPGPSAGLSRTALSR